VSLWFVTPAHRRYALTAVCLDQRRQVITALAEHGIDARCVVVANDENLDTARGLGFDTVETPNEGPDGTVWLGRKFNDGIEHAGKHGAEWIVPIGSDSWIDPAYFLPLADPEVTLTGAEYCHITANRLMVTEVRTMYRAGPYVFHRSLLAPTGFRPADDSRPRGVDGSTISGIEAAGGVIRWQDRSLHPLQYIGFRGESYLTSPDALWQKWGVVEYPDPWQRLAEAYDPQLVERARACVPQEPPRLTDQRGLRRMGSNILIHAFMVRSDGSPKVALCGIKPQDYHRDQGRMRITCIRCRERARRIPTRLAA
jgi:hypothetical protein